MNVAAIGMEATQVRRRQIRTTVQLVPAGCVVAVAGTAVRRALVWLTETTTPLLTRTTTWAFVFAGRCTDYVLAFLHFYPLPSLRAPGRGLLP